MTPQKSLRAVRSLIAIMIAGLCLSSCFPFIGVSRRHVLTEKPRFHGGYQRDAVYELKIPLLYNGQGGLADHFYWPGISSGSRVNYEDFIKSKDDYPGIAIIPTGTRFRFTKMVFTVDPWKGGFEYLSGKLLDGPVSGEEFDLMDVSTCYPDGHSRPRRTEMLGENEISLFWPKPEFVRSVPPGRN